MAWFVILGVIAAMSLKPFTWWMDWKHTSSQMCKDYTVLMDFFVVKSFDVLWNIILWCQKNLKEFLSLRANKIEKASSYLFSWYMIVAINHSFLTKESEILLLHVPLEMTFITILDVIILFSTNWFLS